MIDLNDVIDPALGLTLTSATGINDRGQIVANVLATVPSGDLRRYAEDPEHSNAIALILLQIANAAAGCWKIVLSNAFRTGIWI